MTGKQLRRLGKDDLLKIIIQLKKDQAEMQTKLDAAEQKLNERNLQISEAGSLAEAAIRINEVFETAQKAADDYLRMVRLSNGDVDEQRAEIFRETEERCAARLRETEAQCAAKRSETEAACAERIKKAEEEINARWAIFRKKVQDVIRSHEELSSLNKDK